MSWREQAACAGRGPDAFFASDLNVYKTHKGETQDRYPAARLVCAECPVRLDCLEFALETGQDKGLWGGLDEYERRALRGRRARARAS